MSKIVNSNDFKAVESGTIDWQTKIMNLKQLLCLAGLVLSMNVQAQELKIHVDKKGKIGYVDQDGRDVASFSTELTNIQLAKSENTFVFGLNGSEDPIAVKCKNDETSLATGMELPKEARLAKLARKQLQIAIASCAIDANSIDVIGNKFRQDVMLYKEAHPETVR